MQTSSGPDQNTRIWFFIPLYFDVDSFSQLREQLITLHRSGTSQAHMSFVVIDDSAGEDPAMERLQDFQNLTVITPPLNLGHQRALVFALRVMSSKISDTDIIVTMDGDGEDRPDDVIKLIQTLYAGEPRTQKVVLAQRTHRKTSLRFKALYFFFQILFRSLTGVVIKTGNFACYNARVLRRIIDHPAFDRCYSSTLIALRIPKSFVLCPRGTRYAGQSRMQTIDLAIHGFRMLMPFIDRIAVRLLVAVGILLALTFFVFVELIVAKFYLTLTIPFWAILSVFGLLMASVLLFANFIVLFTVFSQSQSISLQGIEEQYIKGTS